MNKTVQKIQEKIQEKSNKDKVNKVKKTIKSKKVVKLFDPLPVPNFRKVGKGVLMPNTKSKPTQNAVDAFAKIRDNISPEDRIKQRFFFTANKFLYYNVNKQLADSTTQIARDTNTKLNDVFERNIEHYRASTDPAYGLVAEALEKIHKELALNEEKIVSSS